MTEGETHVPRCHRCQRRIRGDCHWNGGFITSGILAQNDLFRYILFTQICTKSVHEYHYKSPRPLLCHDFEVVTWKRPILSKPSIVGFHPASMLAFVGVMYGIFPQIAETAELHSVGASMISEHILGHHVFAYLIGFLNQNGNGGRLQKGQSNKYKKVSKVMGSSLKLFWMCCIIWSDL